MQVNVSIDIDRPAGEVFEYLSDVTNDTAWQKGTETVEWRTRPPIRVGSIYHQIAKFLGRTVESDFEVTVLEPGHLVTVTTTRSTFRMTVTRSVDPLDLDACRARAEISGEPDGLIAKALGPMADLLFEQTVKADFRRLKALLERA